MARMQLTGWVFQLDANSVQLSTLQLVGDTFSTRRVLVGRPVQIIVVPEGDRAGERSLLGSQPIQESSDRSEGRGA